jgi:hypothetical protein
MRQTARSLLGNQHGRLLHVELVIYRIDLSLFREAPL